MYVLGCVVAFVLYYVITQWVVKRHWPLKKAIKINAIVFAIVCVILILDGARDIEVVILFCILVYTILGILFRSLYSLVRRRFEKSRITSEDRLNALKNYLDRVANRLSIFEESCEWLYVFCKLILYSLLFAAHLNVI